MNKAEMINSIAEKTQIAKTDVEKVMTCFFENVKNSLKDKENVKLIGFGTFSSNKRKAKSGRNPQTGETIQVKAKNLPFFKPGKFRNKLNNSKK